MSAEDNSPPDAQERLAALGRVMGELVHDLNNQVMVLQGWAMLAHGELEAGRLPTPEVERVVGITDRMAQMLRDLLDTTAGRAVSPEVTFDPRLLTEETITDRLPGMSTVTLRLRSSLPEGVEIRGRASLWVRALSNLLANATRHARAQVHVALLLERTAHDGDLVVLRVEDDGAGIPAAQRASIFHPFWRGDQGELGLGLSSVDWAVGQLNGTVAYREDSALGGAAFEVRVPAARQLVERRKPDEGSGADIGAMRGARVVILDDDGSVRGATRRLLERSGADVRELDPGGEPEARLIESILAFLPDVVLLDLRLGERGGLALWNRMCLEVPQLAVRVIFVSGSGPGERDWDEAQLSGQPLLGKPFSLSELVRTILRLRAEQ